MSRLLDEIEKLVTPVLAQEQVELVDAAYQKEQGRWTLRFYLDKPGGITLADCEIWSHKIGALLDASDMMPEGYTLEVASPGLYRPLKKIKDFERFKGERVHVKLFAPLNGQRNFEGVLLGADESAIHIKLENESEIRLPHDHVAKAKLNPVIKF